MVGAIAALGACGPGLAVDRPSRPLLAASGDAKQLRALLRAPVIYAGLLFEDPACVQQFPVPGELGEERLDAFATCLAGLHLAQDARSSRLRGVALLTYAPGVEVEARMEERAGHSSLAWIGFAGRHDVRDALPTITAAELEVLRVAGDPDGTPAADVRTELEHEGADRWGPAADAWVRVCLAATGEVTSATPVQVSSARAAEVFAPALSTWRFHPFAMSGRTIPACAYVELAYPPWGEETRRRAALPMALFAKRDHLEVEARGLGTRTAGVVAVAPDAATLSAIRHAQASPITTSVQYCIDERGAVTEATLAGSSGVLPWDSQLVEMVRTWRYLPFVLGGAPAPVCSMATLPYYSSVRVER